MLAPGERELAGSAVNYRSGFGSPELSALAVALTRLVEASDGVADAVTRHDRAALIASNERAEALVDEVARAAERLTPGDVAVVRETGIPALCEWLAASARRNAYLIEQAWATDAALMRMLMGFGKVSPDGSTGGYSTPSGPTYVDRGA
jgi:hypothetical protein